MERLKIEYIPIKELTAYVGNAKEHTREQIDQIKESIENFGFNDPLGIYGPNNTIVEGHGRMIAAQELGIEEVPVIRLDHMSDAERRAYTLVHNKLTMNTDFDVEMLNDELAELLNDDDFNVNMTDFGFEDVFSGEEEEETTGDKTKANNRISIVVECESREEAQETFEKLQSEGYKCRVSTS
jgi:ParB-like chromosome segregation protein Spo0J